MERSSFGLGDHCRYPVRHLLKFTLTNLALAVALVACVTAWYVDHQRMDRRLQKRVVEDSLVSRDVNIRLNAIRELETWGTLENAPAIIFAVSDPEVEIGQRARAIIERISGESFRAPDCDGSYKSLCDENFRWSTWLRSMNSDAPFYIPYTSRNQDEPTKEPLEVLP
ncbi:hypothetical protein N9V88_03665, partial [bacterium]|nr:hypothetical protein [bacterium]